LIISANSGCSGTAIRYKNVTYFREDNVVVSECAYARVFYSSGGSTGYATIVNPTASNYKYGFHFDAANNASSSVNDIKVFGGNMTIDGAPAIGSRNIYVGATNTFHPIDGIAFFGTQIQPPATVKVEVAGGTASFYNVYWDMSNGGTDILLRAPSKNCVFLGGVNLGGQVISDSGMTSAFYDPNKVRATAGGVLIAPRTIDISNKTSGQIKFPKSPNISSDSNTLDDYGEGTWKGAFVADGGSITVNNTYCMGRYTKIGRSVNITGEFRVNSVSSPTGDLYLTGLPYTNGDDFSNVAAVTVWVSGLDPAATGKVQGIISRRARMISFDLIGSGSAGAMAKYMRAGSTIVLTGTYFVD
jgi:hypothetical protein